MWAPGAVEWGLLGFQAEGCTKWVDDQTCVEVFLCSGWMCVFVVFGLVLQYCAKRLAEKNVSEMTYIVWSLDVKSVIQVIAAKFVTRNLCCCLYAYKHWITVVLGWCRYFKSVFVFPIGFSVFLKSVRYQYFKIPRYRYSVFFNALF